MDVLLGMIIGAGLASLAVVAYIKFGPKKQRDTSFPRAFGMAYGSDTGRIPSQRAEDFSFSLNLLAGAVHAANKKWWEEWVCLECEQLLEPLNDHQGLCKNSACANKELVQLGKKKPLKRNKGELIALMHSELSEMLEGARKGLPDDHLPHRSMEECEAADTLIRMLDYVGGFGLDLDGATRDKLAYNRTRADHSHAAGTRRAGRSSDGRT